MAVVTASPRLKRIQRSSVALLVLGCALNYVDRSTLAIANPLNNTVTILLGNGDGTFTTGETLSVGIDPSGLAMNSRS